MLGGIPRGFARCSRRYGRPMKTRTPIAPRSASTEPASIRREGRARATRVGAVAGAVAAALILALGACSPAASTIPGTSIAIPSIALPSVAIPSAVASAAASLAAQAGLAALDQVDAAIATNTSATGLTADDASSLTQLTAGIRTALQSGDTTAARTAVDSLSTKVQALASKLGGTTGPLLTAAINALKAALPAS